MDLPSSPRRSRRTALFSDRKGERTEAAHPGRIERGRTMMPELRSNLPPTSALAIARRAHYTALGIPREDWEKPKVAIVNTSSELAACYSHLDEIAGVLKGELRAAGLLP